MIKMQVDDKVDKLKAANNEKEFATQRAAIQYIGVTCRPDVSANTQLIAPGSEPTTASGYMVLAQITAHLKTTGTRGLKFVPIDMDSARLVIISDASFANARGSPSQLGFLALMVDAQDRANIIHYSSSRCRRVTRSVIAAELHALILAFDFAYVIREMMQEILQRDIQIEALIDSNTVFDIVSKDANTTERRLQIDVQALRESYAPGELARIGWIPGDRNPADALPKLLPLRAGKNNTQLDNLV